MTLKSRYKCIVQELPVGHPKHELGFEYEIEVQGTYKDQVFYSLHYCKAQHVPLLLNYINSDLYRYYLERKHQSNQRIYQ